MAQADIARLIVLATIWSLSFVFIRVLVPVLGPFWVPMLRALIAGIALVAWFAFIRLHADVKRHWRAYLFVGILNSALPFLLFAFAAQHLPASYLVILNALTPLFAALAGAVWLDERMTFATRDHYRHVVERIAARTKRDETTIVKQALDLARGAPASPNDGIRSHVGYYLIDAGLRETLESRRG